MNYWGVRNAVGAILDGHKPEVEKKQQSEYWQTVEAVGNIMDNDIGDGKSWGMRKFIDEGVGALIQKAVMDFLSTEFKSVPKDEVMDDLMDKPEHYADRWIEMAKLHGINNQGGLRLGWKFIQSGEFLDLPGGDRYV